MIALLPAEFGPYSSVSGPNGIEIGSAKTWKPPTVSCLTWPLRKYVSAPYEEMFVAAIR